MNLNSLFEKKIIFVNEVIDNIPPADNFKRRIFKENLSDIQTHYDVVKNELNSVRKWYIQENKSLPKSSIRRKEEEEQRLLGKEVMSELRERMNVERRLRTNLLIDEDNRQLIVYGKEYRKCTPVVLCIIKILHESNEPLHLNKIKNLLEKNPMFQNKPMPYEKPLYDFFRHTPTGKELWQLLIKNEGNNIFSLNYI